MILDDIVNALLQPVEWTPHDAAKLLGSNIAAVRQLDQPQPQLYMRNPPTRLVTRAGRPIDEQPTQLWMRYPIFNAIAFLVTSIKASGIWAEDSYHRFNVHGALHFIDPHGTKYVMEQYESADAFAYAIGSPEFVQAVKYDGVYWITG